MKEEAGGRATIVLQLLRGDFFYCFLSENKLLPQTLFFLTVISVLEEPIKERGSAQEEIRRRIAAR